jgi:hypothetical protein
MQITFYATNTDLLQIVQWLLQMPGIMLFEQASRAGQPNRKFCTVAEVESYFAERNRSIDAWLESTGSRPIPRYIEFEPNTQRRLGAGGRTELVSPSVIRIFRNNDQNGSLSTSYITCWNEKGARQRSMYSAEVLDQVDWKALRSIEGSLKGQVTKASPAKLRSLPIMNDAFSEMREGRLSLWAWGTAYSYPTTDITLI